MAEPRRFVFLAGTAHYVHLDGYDLPSVRDDLHLLRRLFVDEFGYELIGGRPLVNPSSAHLRISLSDWFVAGERTPDDLVIVYYSGHGIVSQGQELFLLTRDSRLEQVPATALSAREIPWHVLPEDPQGGVPTTAAGVFVVIDTCYAGAGTANIIALAAERHAQAGGETTVLALACSRPKEEADQGVFAKALAETLRNRSGRLGGTQQPDIDPFALTDALNDYFGQRDERQRAELGVVRMRRLQPFFPNPQFHAAVPPGLEITAQRAVLAGEVESHVDPEASAIELAPVKVAYFAGRETALAELRTWLNDRPDGRARVVTGGPGSGKSALLRELMAEGIGIDVAIQAKGATGAEIASRIGSALGITTDPDRLVAQLAERRGRCAIVVDALDEASEPGPVSALLSEVARSAPNVHLLVATRPQLLDHLDTHTRTVVDLDAERYFDETDVVRAVAGRLREEPGSPYGSDPDLAEAVAATVARRAGRSFLFAGLMGAGLAAEPTPTMPADVPADVDGVRAALERELERYGDDRERVQDLLRPLAYALGRGFPWAGLWPQLAGALSGSTYVDADIEWLLGNAGGLVIEDVEDDRSVYRLFHEELARTLGGAGAQADAHAAVVERLLAAVPAAPNGGADWARADPYARRHLSTHAIRAGLLDELTHDVGFLAAAEPERLLTALDRAGQRELAQVVRMSLHRTGRASIAERAAYLELIAREQGLEDLAAQLRAGDLDPPWHCRWAYWTPASPHRVIATPHGEAYAHEAIEVHGVMTLFTGPPGRHDSVVGPPLGRVARATTSLRWAARDQGRSRGRRRASVARGRASAVRRAEPRDGARRHGRADRRPIRP